MLVNEMKLKQIIERKVKYIETDDDYTDLDMQNIKKGELEAYKEIMHDISSKSEEDFVIKYSKIIKEIKVQFERLDKVLDEIEFEQLVGYNDAIKFALSLINPIYENFY